MKKYWEIRLCDLALSEQIIDFMKCETPENRDFWKYMLNSYVKKNLINNFDWKEPVGAYIVVYDKGCELSVSLKSRVKESEYKGLLISKLRRDKLKRL
jgi:hypothetical protein